jgi:DNA-binding Lrp family transcriptional regulator
MTIAFILIQCGNIDVELVIEDLKKVKSIIEIQGVFGSYDIIVKMQAKDRATLQEIITLQIRTIKKLGITQTSLLNCSDGE